MSGMSPVIACELLDSVLRDSGQIRIALWVGNPGDDGTAGGEEVTGTGYTRQNIDFAAASMTTKSSRNSGQVSWASPGSDWGVITHWTLHDTSSAERQLFYGAFEDQFDAEEGSEAITIEVGDLEVTFGDATDA